MPATIVGRLFRALERRLSPAPQAPFEADPDVPMTGLLCVCAEDGCWCGAIVEVPTSFFTMPGLTVNSWPCPDCRRGRHVLTPGGPRS